MMKWMNDYEYKVIRLDNLFKILNHSHPSSIHRAHPSKNELYL